MGRSPLFSLLRRLLDPTTAGRPRDAALSRRELLSRTLGGAALAGVAAACGDTTGGSDDAADRDTRASETNTTDTTNDASADAAIRGVNVVIVGGGMAGLHAAYRLKQSGVVAQVYEASPRLGGRMWSKRDGFADGQLCEIGGELIDTPHTIMQILANELDIALDDLKSAVPAGEIGETFFFNGKVVAKADLLAEWAPLAPKLSAAVLAAEADDDEFARLDALSIPAFLDEAGAGPLIKEILTVAFTEEYGLEADEQPVLNMLYLIDADTTDDFVVFGASDERFHTHLGNETFIEKLAAELTGQTQTDAALIRIGPDGDQRYQLTFERPSDGTRFGVVADHVILTLPFTLLRRIDMAGLDLPAAKRQLIDELGYGTNAKLMMQFSRRVWQTDHESSGAIFSDNGIQTSWDTSRGQIGAHGIITNFVGGAIGVAMGESTAEARAQAILPAFDAVFPGMQAAYVAGSAVRMHWPTYPWARGSYACYKLGQWSTYGLEGTRVGGLHFAGEHTSKTWQGYMEGAAESGVFAAIEVLEALGKSVPLVLTGLVAGREPPTPPEEAFGGSNDARDARRRFESGRRARSAR